MEVTKFKVNFEGNVETGSDGVKTLMKANLSLNAIFSGLLGKLVIYVATHPPNHSHDANAKGWFAVNALYFPGHHHRNC